MLDGLQIVLVKTRFPENIGMAARACVNMGCTELCLVAPERWDRERAAPLATPKGRGLLEAATVCGSLEEAVASSHLVVGTTARAGGWRNDIVLPGQAAAEVARTLARGERVSLVFGPEDRGLENREISRCRRLVSIPVERDAPSLNLAQAALLLLYECAGAVRALRAGPPAPKRRDGHALTTEELERLLARFKETLLALDCLHGDNPDYFFMSWRRLFGRIGLKRHEYDALMGLCRQIDNMRQR